MSTPRLPRSRRRRFPARPKLSVTIARNSVRHWAAAEMGETSLASTDHERRYVLRITARQRRQQLTDQTSGPPQRALFKQKDRKQRRSWTESKPRRGSSQSLFDDGRRRGSSRGLICLIHKPSWRHLPPKPPSLPLPPTPPYQKGSTVQLRRSASGILPSRPKVIWKVIWMHSSGTGISGGGGKSINRMTIRPSLSLFSGQRKIPKFQD